MLKTGDIVYLETTDYMFGEVKDKALRKMRVYKANKTSAYIWYADKEIDERHRTFFKVNQRTLSTRYPVPDGYMYRAWLSEESYHEHKSALKLRAELEAAAQQIVSSATTSQLKQIVKEMEKHASTNLLRKGRKNKTAVPS